MMKKKLLKTALAIFSALWISTICQAEEMKMNIQDVIETFRKTNDIEPFMAGDHPNPEILRLLAEQMETGNSDTREKVLGILEKINRDTPYHAESRQKILDILVNQGLAVNDSRRDDVIIYLTRAFSAASLAPYGEKFTKALEEDPSYHAFLLVAKAKPKNAYSVVEGLGRKYKDGFYQYAGFEEARRITLAALGDKKIESEYISELTKMEAAIAANANGKTLLNNSDRKTLIAIYHDLAIVGTPGTLKALAERLRTPLIGYDDGYVRTDTSMRRYVMGALAYVFNDEPAINSWRWGMQDEDYIAAEEFCMKRLNAEYTAPRPPFFTERQYPHPTGMADGSPIPPRIPPHKPEDFIDLSK